jgi:hypothetical protein
MGFGIGDIVGGIKNAVSSAGEALGNVAQKVGSGAEAVEQKVSDTVKSAVDALSGQSGFDGGSDPGPTLLVESKPKGTGGSHVA